jgi:hypothetical protein
MLSIVADQAGDVVHLHADLAGLEALEHAIASLRQRVANGECEDSHLFSQAWGGAELTESMLPQEQSSGCRQVHHLKLYGWTQGWAHKHGLSKDAP